MERSSVVPQKLNIKLPYDPEIPLLGIYPRELKTYVHTNTFTRALFVIAKKWKQPKCSSIHEWVNKIWCSCKMEYDLALKRNEL